VHKEDGLEHIGWALDDGNRWISWPRATKGGECQRVIAQWAIEAADAERLRPDLPMTSCGNWRFSRMRTIQ
jgi:hypothetical protein